MRSVLCANAQGQVNIVTHHNATMPPNSAGIAPVSWLFAAANLLRNRTQTHIRTRTRTRTQRHATMLPQQLQIAVPCHDSTRTTSTSSRPATPASCRSACCSTAPARCTHTHTHTRTRTHKHTNVSVVAVGHPSTRAHKVHTPGTSCCPAMQEWCPSTGCWTASTRCTPKHVTCQGTGNTHNHFRVGLCPCGACTHPRFTNAPMESGITPDNWLFSAKMLLGSVAQRNTQACVNKWRHPKRVTQLDGLTRG